MQRSVSPNEPSVLKKHLFIYILFYLVFSFYPVLSKAQNRYDVVITEIMPDPSPAVGLPESEFIELKNRSASDFNLRNWTIGNGTVLATIKTDYILKADSFLILCSSSAAADFASQGPVLGISGFPSLYNDAGDIILTSSSGKTQHAIHYDKSWYGNELKATGGWSLEMIDPLYPASGRANWTASRSDRGGTPGKINSADASNPDNEPPSLLRAFATDSSHLLLLFDEAVDSTSSSSGENYFVSDGIGTPDSSFSAAPFFDRVAIHLPLPLEPGKTYTITVSHLTDCSNNDISLRNSCKAGIAQAAKKGDIIFNEVLFNPAPGGYDYIELYNRSAQTINIPDLFLAGRDGLGNLKDPIPITKENRAFFPGDYLLLTVSPEWTLHQYPLSDSVNMMAVSALPSMPDDAGKLVLLNEMGDSLDELDYDHHWHSPLISNESGVALERIRSDLPTNLPGNWSSASEGSGYGTPGYKNSEFYSDSTGADFITAIPKLFSPDMDGYQDFCFVNYQLPAAGFIGSISIFDITGRVVRRLANNFLMGTSGSFRWDGFDEQQNLLPAGHYIIYAEVFRTNGDMIKKKLVITLARRHS